MQRRAVTNGRTSAAAVQHPCRSACPILHLCCSCLSSLKLHSEDCTPYAIDVFNVHHRENRSASSYYHRVWINHRVPSQRWGWASSDNTTFERGRML
ncbi:hypothetical protein EJ02DRAFT_147531 [Clathrospora elynae]|uniref:Uncharacterized protein n=1 Tax=Clathrospora elynae TaxID=706981 RepID=A0A6A5S366_9PLEO|nr:hypothetical protein EJ02DRAFT_147531 [Clathrospora elynae]